MGPLQGKAFHFVTGQEQLQDGYLVLIPQQRYKITSPHDVAMDDTALEADFFWGRGESEQTPSGSCSNTIDSFLQQRMGQQWKRKDWENGRASLMKNGRKAQVFYLQDKLNFNQDFIFSNVHYPQEKYSESQDQERRRSEWVEKHGEIMQAFRNQIAKNNPRAADPQNVPVLVAGDFNFKLVSLRGGGQNSAAVQQSSGGRPSRLSAPNGFSLRPGAAARSSPAGPSFKLSASAVQRGGPTPQGKFLALGLKSSRMLIYTDGDHSGTSLNTHEKTDKRMQRFVGRSHDRTPEDVAANFVDVADIYYTGDGPLEPVEKVNAQPFGEGAPFYPPRGQTPLLPDTTQTAPFRRGGRKVVPEVADYLRFHLHKEGLSDHQLVFNSWVWSAASRCETIKRLVEALRVRLEETMLRSGSFSSEVEAVEDIRRLQEKIAYHEEWQRQLSDWEKSPTK